MSEMLWGASCRQSAEMACVKGSKRHGDIEEDGLMRRLEEEEASLGDKPLRYRLVSPVSNGPTPARW